MSNESSRLQATQARHDMQRMGIVSAVELATHVSREVAEVATHHALMAAADALRHEAKVLTEGRAKGHVGTSKELHAAAGRVAAIAVKIPGALTTDINAAQAAEEQHAPEGVVSQGIEAFVATLPSVHDMAPAYNPTREESDARVATARAETHALLNGLPNPSNGSAPMNADLPGPNIPGAFGPGQIPAGYAGPPIPLPRQSTEQLAPAMSPAAPLAASRLTYPDTTPGLDGQPVATLLGGLPATPPMDSLTGPVDPFADPGGRHNERRLTFTDFRHLAAGLHPSSAMSVSKVESMACGMKYALNKIAKANPGLVREQPSWALIGGNAFHAWALALETFFWQNGCVPDVSPDSFEAWFLSFLDREYMTEIEGTPYSIHDIRPSNKGKEGYDWWRVEGGRMIGQYLAVHDADYRSEWRVLSFLDPLNPDGPGRPALEVEFAMMFGTAKVRGKIDVIKIKQGSGPAVIRVDDYKTGRTAGSVQQLATYGNAARSLGLTGHIVASNYDARAGAYTDLVSPDAYPLDDLVYDYETAAKMDAQGLFVASPSPWCYGCSFQRICPKAQSR